MYLGPLCDEAIAAIIDMNAPKYMTSLIPWMNADDIRLGKKRFPVIVACSAEVSWLKLDGGISDFIGLKPISDAKSADDGAK